MEHEEEYKIPAASIGDIDLDAIAKSNLDMAKEIARIDELMNQGKESKEEFLDLCRLLFEAGSVEDSEYLLRRNLEYYNGESLYAKLFGTKKHDEYSDAIAMLESQFETKLALVEETDYLISKFHSNGSSLKDDRFHMLSYPCEIIIEYAKKDIIEADIGYREPFQETCDPQDYLLLSFINETWGLNAEA